MPVGWGWPVSVGKESVGGTWKFLFLDWALGGGLWRSWRAWHHGVGMLQSCRHLAHLALQGRAFLCLVGVLPPIYYRGIVRSPGMGMDLGCVIQVHIQVTSPLHLPAHVPCVFTHPQSALLCLDVKCPPRLMCPDTWSPVVHCFWRLGKLWDHGPGNISSWKKVLKGLSTCDSGPSSLLSCAGCTLQAPTAPEYSKPPHHNELYFLKLWTKTKAFLPQVVHVKDLSLWPEKCPLCLILSGNFYRPMTRNIWQSLYGPGWLWTHCIKPYTVTVSAVWSPCSWAAGSIASSYRQRAIVMQRPGQQVGEAEFFGG